ncbi:hypothetical protein R80B4_02507 [Fibrobacteres bacterium R8-0-B4]
MPVKKTTKKAAKKTYPPAKKAFPKRRFMTAEEYYAAMAERDAKTAALHAELAAAHAETEIAMKKLFAAQAKTEAAHLETEAAMEKLLAAQAKTEAAHAKTEATVERVSLQIGHIGNDIGELTEFIVIPKIRLAMNAAGKHTFDNIQTDRLFKKIDELGEKKFITEVDVLLTGVTEAMAVETKTHPMIRDVKSHLKRLETLRQYEDLVDIKGKKLFGAMVGAIIDRDVKNFALERGLYVVKIREEEEKLDVAEPETRGTW